jgi:hypothetical protein
MSIALCSQQIEYRPLLIIKVEVQIPLPRKSLLVRGSVDF